MDFDAGVTDRSHGEGEREPLQQREIDMDVEPLSLMRGKAISNDLKLLPDRVQVIQAFLQAEVRQVVGGDFVTQEGQELFVLLEEGVFEVSAEDMVAVLNLFDDVRVRYLLGSILQPG